MKLVKTAFVCAAGPALGIVLAASPATAQYGAGQPATGQPMTGEPATAQGAASRRAAPAQPVQKQLKLSPQAGKAIMALQAAVTAKNSAAIPGLLTAAQAVAKVADDRAAIASLQLQAAIDAKDPAGLVAGADAMRAAGAPISASSLGTIYISAAQTLIDAKQFAPASAALDKAVAADPSNIDVLLLRSDLFYKQNQMGPSIEALSQAIARKKASGAAVPESWLQAGVARAYGAKLPIAYGMAQQWVTAYPTQAHWRDAINIYRNMSGSDRAGLIDMFRLARVTKALGGESDYVPFAEALMARGYPGEAVAVLKEGAAANSINLTSATFSRTYALAQGKSIGDRAAATAAARTAVSASTAAMAMSAADRLLGYGDFAQAATLYRATLGKSGADTNLINLHLGEALAQSGDKAGAIAALSAVGGTQAEIGRYWLAWVNSRG